MTPESGLNNALIPKARYPQNLLEEPTTGEYEPYLSKGIDSPFIQTEISNTVDNMDGMSNNAYLNSLVSNTLSEDPYHNELPGALSYPMQDTKPTIDKFTSEAGGSNAYLDLTDLRDLQGVNMNQIATGFVEISSQPQKRKPYASGQFLDVLGQGGPFPEHKQKSRPQSSPRGNIIQSSFDRGVQRLLNQETTSARRTPYQQNSPPSTVQRATGSQHRSQSQLSNLSPRPLAGVEFADQVVRVGNSGASNVADRSTAVISAVPPTSRTSQQSKAHRHSSNNALPVEVPTVNRKIRLSAPSSSQINIKGAISNRRRLAGGQQPTIESRAELHNARVQKSSRNVQIVPRQQTTVRNKKVPLKTNPSSPISQVQTSALPNVPKRPVRLRETSSAMQKTNGQRQLRGRISVSNPHKSQRMIPKRNSNMQQQPARITEVPIRESRMNSVGTKTPSWNNPTRRKVSFNVPREPQRNPVVNNKRQPQTTRQFQMNRTSNSQTPGPPSISKQQRPQTISNRQPKIARLINAGRKTPSRNVQKEPKRPVNPIQQVLRHPMQHSPLVGNTNINTIKRKDTSQPIRNSSGLLSVKNALFSKPRKTAFTLRSKSPTRLNNFEALPLPRLPSRAVINPAVPSVPSAVIQQSNQPGISASALTGLTSQTVSGGPSVNTTANSTVPNATSSVTASTVTNIQQNTASSRTVQPSSIIGQNTVTVPSVVSNNPTTSPNAATPKTTSKSTQTKTTLPQSNIGHQTRTATVASAVFAHPVPQMSPNNLATSTINTAGQAAQTPSLQTQNSLPLAFSGSGTVSNTAQVSRLQSLQTVIPPSASTHTGSTLPGTQLVNSVPLAGVPTHTTGSLTPSTAINTAAQNIQGIGNSQIGSSVPNSNIAQTTAKVPTSSAQTGVAASGTGVGTHSTLPQSVLDSINVMIQNLQLGKQPIVPAIQQAPGAGNLGIVSSLQAPRIGGASPGQIGIKHTATGLTQPVVQGTPTASRSLASQTPQRIPTSSSSLYPAQKHGHQQKSKIGAVPRTDRHMSSQPFITSSVSTSNQHHAPTSLIGNKTTSGRQAPRAPSNPTLNFSNNPLQPHVNVVNYPPKGKPQTSPQIASLNNHNGMVSSHSHSKRVGPKFSSQIDNLSPNTPDPKSVSFMETKPYLYTGSKNVPQTSHISNPYPKLPGRLRSDAFFTVEKGVVENKNLRSFLLQNIIDGPSRSLSDGVQLYGNQDQFYNPLSSHGMIDHSLEYEGRFRPTHQQSRSPDRRQQDIRQRNEIQRQRSYEVISNHPESMNSVNFFNPLSPAIRNVRVTQAFF